MVRLASDAARSHEFHANSLRVSLIEIARRSYGDANTVEQALEEGWRRTVRHAAADGSITHDEEFRHRRFQRPAGTEPEHPRPGNGTTEPDIQAEAPVADPSHHHHCRRR